MKLGFYKNRDKKKILNINFNFFNFLLLLLLFFLNGIYIIFNIKIKN